MPSLRLARRALVTGALAAVPAAAVFSTASRAQSSKKASAEEIAAHLSDAMKSKGAALVLPVAALATPEVRKSVQPFVIDPETGVAMEGYDPVGYFTEGAPLRGDPQYAAKYQGATFHFASAQTRNLFVADPERYAPAFGGYCTQTLAMGSLTPASPLHWTIHGDRLFLTRSAAANETFRSTRKEVITAGERYWADASDAFQLGPNAKAHVAD